LSGLLGSPAIAPSESEVDFKSNSILQNRFYKVELDLKSNSDMVSESILARLSDLSGHLLSRQDISIVYGRRVGDPTSARDETFQ